MESFALKKPSVALSRYHLVNPDTGECTTASARPLVSSASLGQSSNGGGGGGRFGASAAEESKTAVKKAKTALTIKSERAKKRHEKAEAVRKLQQRNGLVFNADGTLERVHRPWEKHAAAGAAANALVRNDDDGGGGGDVPHVEAPPAPRYEARPTGCLNAQECTLKQHYHDMDRTILGREEWCWPRERGLAQHNSRAGAASHPVLSTVADQENLKITTLGRAATTPMTDERGAAAAHDHHPFLAPTNAALDAGAFGVDAGAGGALERRTLIVDADTELKMCGEALFPHVSDAFHTALRLMREEINAKHACQAELRTVHQAFERSCANEVVESPAPHRARRELAEVRDKRLERARRCTETVIDVIKESFEAKMRDILQRCVAAQLLRPQAVSTAYGEVLAHYREFAHTRNEVQFLDELVCLFQREQLAQ